jgi:hypothetical protein
VAPRRWDDVPSLGSPCRYAELFGRSEQCSIGSPRTMATASRSEANSNLAERCARYGGRSRAIFIRASLLERAPAAIGLSNVATKNNERARSEWEMMKGCAALAHSGAAI